MTPATSPWLTHRRRAEFLSGRHAFAAQVLTLYLAVLDVWEQAWQQARTRPPPPQELVPWAAQWVLPDVVKVTAASGPPYLAATSVSMLAAGGLEDSMSAWLAGDELGAVERYLARACLHGPLRALQAGAGPACAADPAPRGGRNCPRCGGLPQLSIRTDGGDPLVSGPRRLGCARCAHQWTYTRSACPSCGETTGSQRTVYAEQPPAAGNAVIGPGTPAEASQELLPHLRIEACATCERYIIDVDLGRDAGAVPDVDELVALPLDLYAAEHGLTKITPNLMGF
jgi:FdhE protein